MAVGLMGVLAGAPACGEDKEARRAAKAAAFERDHGAALRDKAAKLEAIVADAASRAPLGSVAPAAGVAKLHFGKGGNAEAVNLETLTQAKAQVFLAYKNGHGLKALQDLAAGREPLQSSLRDAVPLDYLLVVRQAEFVDPVEKTGTLFKFKPGRVAGDALLYGLAKGEFLGGVPYQAASSETVTASREHTEAALRGDLSRRAEEAIAAALAPLAEDLKPPSR